MIDMLSQLATEEGAEIAPGVRVRLRSLADYQQNPENPVSHSPRNLSTIVESVHKVGAARSGLAADGTIYAGNLTSEAMAIAGIEGVIEITTDGTKWVMVNRPDLTPEQRKQAAHGDQWSAMLAEMNVDQLLADIEAGVNLDGIYSEFDLEAILGEALVETGEAPEAQMDRAEELQEKWQVNCGDLWQCGRHLILCGDSTKVEDMARVMGGERGQLLFTSPPYWVGKDYEYQTTLDEVKEFIDKCASVMAESVTKDGGRIVINTSTASAKAINPKADPETLFSLAWWQESLRKHDWLMRHCRVWLKHGDMAAPRVAARSDVIDQHWEMIPEFLPTFYNPDGLRRGQEKIGMKWAQLGIWNDIPGERSAGGVHIAAFPVELPERYIRLYSKIDEIIVEPFLGSGTTMVAAERLKRICRALEIYPPYISVSLERMANMGLEPKLLE